MSVLAILGLCIGRFSFLNFNVFFNSFFLMKLYVFLPTKIIIKILRFDRNIVGTNICNIQILTTEFMFAHIINNIY